MTSVPSLRQPLSGSNLPLLFLLFLLFSACSAPKKVAKAPPSTPPGKENEEKVRVYDPASGQYILVPKSSVKVDTVKWSEDKTPPLVTDKQEVPDQPVKKDKYEISLLIPLNSLNYPELEGQIDSRLIRFMQYYGGMRIAADEIDRLGLPITIRSYDTESSVSQLNEILKDPGVRRADVIIGPYDKENIEAVASFGLLNQKLVISPWLPAFNIEQENPFFIQAVPGLNKNAEAIMEYVSTHLKDRKIYLVARNNPSEIQRLMMFKNHATVKTEDLIIDDVSIELAKTNLSFLLEDREGTVFVMPYYSRNDEQFVSSFLRKLHADKGTHNVIVFGLPQWTGFNSLNPNYMESLSVHISSPVFVNNAHPSYRSFRDRFYKSYFTMPDQHAYQGYDLLLWVAKSLAAGGKEGLMKQTGNSDFGLASGFEIEPVFKEDTRRTDERQPLYYENAKVHILKYVNQDFEIAR